MRDLPLTNGRDRRPMAIAHAWRAHHPCLVGRGSTEFAQQLFCAGELAAEAVADPHRDRRRRRLTLGHDIEMSIEAGDFVHLSMSQVHLLGQRCEMAGAEVAIVVLKPMQMFDQEIAAPRFIAKKCADIGQRTCVHLPSFGVRFAGATTGAGVTEMQDLGRGLGHLVSLILATSAPRPRRFATRVRQRLSLRRRQQ